jgi:thiol:disulfide interchange protein DsbA
LLGSVFGIAAAALCAAAQAQIEAAKKALDSYQVKGVPSFVIDGKYLTSAKMAGGVREMMRVVEQLVERAAVERRK